VKKGNRQEKQNGGCKKEEKGEKKRARKKRAEKTHLELPSEGNFCGRKVKGAEKSRQTGFKIHKSDNLDGGGYRRGEREIGPRKDQFANQVGVRKMER